MFGAQQNRAAAYAKVGVETGVSTASPHQLIVMLFDGALMSLATASAAIDKNDIPGKGNAISKAIEIILNGLKASLDMDAGGELSERLSALYEYMAERLLYANLHNNKAALNEVMALLGNLREAWIAINPDQQARGGLS
ncbi:flagellar export chaperone FliS [Azoarcus communis]|jgi:flagellar protein FliS|uniref:Flagellar secretion chaperone FliS n=1 Tax=Parazoarcus communis SWub3 = DSM 12120 TaxID=1121029 RepID=A0A323UTM3_9RHOO|nr:flagellar export chaperone FliS [Parazoarcus communis]NMG48365.1 flagellar export chaperone FliS [Parazoarcus communis]NMG70608.1 flagellar export chaperone FliS [Parazoarcus communis SWub3 = DSM 12120]PZA15737.1 flagellar export chaperone FliS [Azoarcus communis] [Parazoarcus communis SWub3 = DSM 12120]